ncbi:retrotransposon gag protein, partial [Tanacetum coccineum]
RINITSKSVKNFLFSGYVDPEDPEGYISDLEDVLEINVPHILSLTIQHKCVSFSQSSLKLLYEKNCPKVFFSLYLLLLESYPLKGISFGAFIDDLTMPPRKDTSNDNAPTSFQDQLSALNAKVDALVNSMTNLLQPPAAAAAAPPPPNNPLHKSPKIMLPTFDGTCPLDWLFQADQYFTFYNIPVDQRVFYCRLSSSKVMLWLVTSKCNNNGLLGDWVTFTRALELRFGPSSFANHQAALFKLKQDGSVATYQTEFERLSNCVVGLPHTALLNCFISGLRPDIQQEIAIYHPTTLHQTYGLAKLIEDKLAATQSQFTSSTGPPFISPTTQTTTTQPVTKPPAILPNPAKQTTPFTISDTGLNQLGGANSGDIQTHQFLALSAAALHGTTCPLAIRITGQINCDTLVQCWWTSGSSLLSSTLSQFHYCTSHSIPNPHFPYDWYWYRFSIARAMPQHSTLRSFRYLIFLYLRCFPLLKVLDVSVRHCPWLCRPRASQKADFSGATTYFNSPRVKMLRCVGSTSPKLGTAPTLRTRS